MLHFAGMTKLLQRLPDRSREEVRNQAIVLVQQLTAQNEEMKKTVVFNEVRAHLNRSFYSFLLLVYLFLICCCVAGDNPF